MRMEALTRLYAQYREYESSVFETENNDGTTRRPYGTGTEPMPSGGNSGAPGAKAAGATHLILSSVSNHAISRTLAAASNLRAIQE